MWKEFKEFATRGNVMDLSIGVIIGGAFGKIVTSLVGDIIMPVISLLTGKVTGNVDFTNLFISLDGTNYRTLAEAAENGAATLNYGMFISVLIDFFIIAFSIFIMVRQMNKLRPQPAPVEPTTRACPFCISDISIEATRCPNCTSILDAEEIQEGVN